MARKPLMKIHAGVQPPMAEIALPYALVHRRRHRAPHAICRSVARLPVQMRVLPVVARQDRLAVRARRASWPSWRRCTQRGARLFKFVDRTFNLNIKTSLKIMQFFLDKLAARPDDPVYAHFELVPDHLPDALKDAIAQFPPGTLQFEIGIQSFNPEVQALVSRRQDNDKAAANIRWLRAAFARASARRPDRRPAGRRHGQFRARLRPAGGAEAA